LTFKYEWHPSLGHFLLSANGSYLHITDRAAPDVSETVLTGTTYNPPKVRARAGLSWDRSFWGAAAFWNFVSRETDTFGATPVPISSFSTFDAQISYKVSEGSSSPLSGMRVGLGASNLFDRNPPRIPQTIYSQASGNYDGVNASPFGRIVTLVVSK